MLPICVGRPLPVTGCDCYFFISGVLVAGALELGLRIGSASLDYGRASAAACALDGFDSLQRLHTHLMNSAVMRSSNVKPFMQASLRPASLAWLRISDQRADLAAHQEPAGEEVRPVRA